MDELEPADPLSLRVLFAAAVAATALLLVWKGGAGGPVSNVLTFGTLGTVIAASAKSARVAASVALGLGTFSTVLLLLGGVLVDLGQLGDPLGVESMAAPMYRAASALVAMIVASAILSLLSLRRQPSIGDVSVIQP